MGTKSEPEMDFECARESQRHEEHEAITAVLLWMMWCVI